jgi:hypothetical protein
MCRAHIQVLFGIQEKPPHGQAHLLFAVTKANAEKTKSEQYVIYADNCLLPKDFMAKKNIIFKKIPRDITKF